LAEICYAEMATLFYTTICKHACEYSVLVN